MVRIGAFTVAVAVGLIAYWYLAPRSSSFGMFEGAEMEGVGRFALSFMATIGGVVLGSFYRELQRLKATGTTKIENSRAFVSEVLRGVDLWLGLAGAPIVYSLLLKASDGMNLPGLLAIALENGFCCLIIVNGFVDRTGQQVR